MQLIRIGHDLGAGGHRGLQANARLAKSRILGSRFQGRKERQGYRHRHGFLGLAIGQHLGCQGHGPVKGSLQPWQGLTDARIAKLGQPLRRHLCAGQHIAQVVIDLGHRLA